LGKCILILILNPSSKKQKLSDTRTELGSKKRKRVQTYEGVDLCWFTGVGWSMTRKLSKMGVETCGDLQKFSQSALQKEFGLKTGQSLYRFCRGEDDRPIRTEKERKSVSAEVNYGIRFQIVSEVHRFF
jgi:nucleotidyltransferase/DNA polymerase involved in DNA repair